MTMEQYIAVGEVQPDDIEYIDSLRMCGDLSKMRIAYDVKKSLMIIKLMAGAPHERVIVLFRDMFQEKVPVRLEILDQEGLEWKGKDTKSLVKHIVQAPVFRNQIGRPLWWRLESRRVFVTCTGMLSFGHVTAAEK